MASFESVAIFVFSLAGGVGLIVLALQILSTALQNLGGQLIAALIRGLNNSVWRSFAIGGATSFLVHSGVSTATMGVSFVGTGALGVPQAVFFLLGTQLGTVLTPWIFTIDMGYLDLYLLGVGVLPMLHARWPVLGSVGRFIFAMGLLLLGYRLALQGVLDPEAFRRSLGLDDLILDGLTALLILLLSVGLSFLFRSRLALVGLACALVELQFLNTSSAILFVLGVNLGGALPVIMAGSRASVSGQRVAWLHFAFQVVALLLVLPAFESFVNANEVIVTYISEPLAASYLSGVAAVLMSHLTFNLLIVAVGVTARPFLWRLIERWIPTPKEKEMQQLRFHGQILSLPPSLSLALAHHEVEKMAAMVETVLELTDNWLKNKGAHIEDVERILKYESIADSVEEEVGEFLTHVNRLNLTAHQSRHVKILLRMADELESIADDCKSIFHRSVESETPLSKPLSEVQERLIQISSANLQMYEKFFEGLSERRGELFELPKDAEFQFTLQALSERQQFFSTLADFFNGDEQNFAIQQVEILQALSSIRSHTFNLYKEAQALAANHLLS